MAKEIRIQGRYDLSAARAVVQQTVNLPDSTAVVLDGQKVCTLKELRECVYLYEDALKRNPLRKRQKTSSKSQAIMIVDEKPGRKAGEAE